MLGTCDAFSFFQWQLVNLLLQRLRRTLKMQNPLCFLI